MKKPKLFITLVDEIKNVCSVLLTQISRPKIDYPQNNKDAETSEEEAGPQGETRIRVKEETRKTASQHQRYGYLEKIPLLPEGKNMITAIVRIPAKIVCSVLMIAVAVWIGAMLALAYPFWTIFKQIRKLTGWEKKTMMDVYFKGGK